MPKLLPHSKSETVDPVDVMIGKNIRFRRNLIGITQDTLGKKLGISFQQIQKYESGQNKIAASKLYHIAKALKVSISTFFEEEALAQPEKYGMSDQEQEGFMTDDPVNKTETTTLIRTYYDIKDKKKRKAALDMIKALQS